ncbi:hypothetical protein MA16_Dca013702 [Dendrobium catenatum]|uniref:Uncharacterized protein n=1 Tax=Dendrobium catenatum TaxID=906689 RepID=A0A2I0WPL5_9ASPA|nr:hypothetical protein MA16_Dca013702 [Dendrobium catenatum]
MMSFLAPPISQDKVRIFKIAAVFDLDRFWTSIGTFGMKAAGIQVSLAGILPDAVGQQPGFVAAGQQRESSPRLLVSSFNASENSGQHYIAIRKT